MTNGITHHAGGGMSIVGEEAMKLYGAAVLRSAIKLYLKTGMRANRMYTPTNMLFAAGTYTGKTYKRGQLQQAFDDLDVWLEEKRGDGTVAITHEGATT